MGFEKSSFSSVRGQSQDAGGCLQDCAGSPDLMCECGGILSILFIGVGFLI